jgi:hypothetical protein
VTPAQPARIHLLPAAKAPMVVVIRRKPSKLFHIIRVDTVTGKAEHGAWFDGRLYPGRCDVSFDGNWFIYLALGARGNTWNAVSKLPRLTAIAESRNMGTYFGGGYWRSRDVLCLNRWAPGEAAKLPFRTEQLIVQHGGEDLGVLYPRLERDGWRRRGDNWGRDERVKGAKTYTVAHTGDDGWERQPSSRHPALIMWYVGYLAHGYTFRFRVPSQPELLDDDVDWATYDSRGQLVAARKGVVTIYGLRGRKRLEAVHALDFESARPSKRETK